MTWSADWTINQLQKLQKEQPHLVDSALRQLLHENKQLAWSLVVNAYLEEEINLGKAAELLEVHEPALRDRFIQLGIPLRMGPENLDAAIAESKALDTWLDAPHR